MAVYVKTSDTTAQLVSTGDTMLTKTTKDILSDALNTDQDTVNFYRMSGTDYEGDLPTGSNYNTGNAIVFNRGGYITVILFPRYGYTKPVVNNYMWGGSWTGWYDFMGNEM